MKTIKLDNDAFDFLLRHLPKDHDVRLIEAELGNRDLSLLDDVVRALLIAEENDYER